MADYTRDVLRLLEVAFVFLGGGDIEMFLEGSHNGKCI